MSARRAFSKGLLHALRRLGAPPVRIRIRFGGGTRRARWFRRSDARPAPKVPTDARTATDPLQLLGVPPELERVARLRFLSYGTALALLFVATALLCVFGAHGYFDVVASRRELAELEDLLGAQHAKVDALRAEVQRLKEDPAALERIAREKLNLVRRGEITFLLPTSEPQGMIERPAPVLPPSERSRVP